MAEEKFHKSRDGTDSDGTILQGSLGRGLTIVELKEKRLADKVLKK